MTELLTSLSAVAKAFIDVFVIGLVNFDNIVLSIIDYILWLPLIFALLKKLMRK